MAESPGKRNTEKESSNQTMYHREPRIALPTKIRIHTENEADDNTINAIPMQIFGSHRYNRSIIRKNTGQCFRQELGIHADADAKDQSHRNASTQAVSKKRNFFIMKLLPSS